MTTQGRLRVVVVEDSAVQRAHLRRVLEADQSITVVGEAADADAAVERVHRLRPDAVTMDLHIPGGGVEAIERIMADVPVPILVLSVAVASKSSTLAIDALAAGAADAVPKPPRWDARFEADLRERVRSLRTVKARPPVGTASPVVGRRASEGLVGIAASTGGPPALVTVLSGLAGVEVPIVIVQHLHAEFMVSFATWLRRSVPFEVVVVTDGELLAPGRVFVGPPGAHVRVAARHGRPHLVLDPAPATIHRPSADELFRSMAGEVGAHGVGVLLTGMGEDGAAGLLALRQAGGHTIAQDEATSAVYGMPRAAVRAGAVDELRPLSAIAGAVIAALGGRSQ